MSYLENLTDIESDSIGLFEIPLENQVMLLEFLKRFKDIEKGAVRGKGFGNYWKLNSKRDPNVFTKIEREFNELAQAHGLTLKHEVRIKVSDRYNKRHIFKLDFFDTNTRYDVEISPNWHKNYRIVERRDQLRKRLLKKVGITVLVVPTIQIGNRCVINRLIAGRVIKRLKSAKASRNSLAFYIS
jgi:hypothetical protein